MNMVPGWAVRLGGKGTSQLSSGDVILVIVVCRCWSLLADVDICSVESLAMTRSTDGPGSPVRADVVPPFKNEWPCMGNFS